VPDRNFWSAAAGFVLLLGATVAILVGRGGIATTALIVAAARIAYHGFGITRRGR
jgi:hypothetical protein